MPGKEPVKVGIVGCGAVAELYYAPALRALERDGHVQVVSLTDVDPKRLAKLAAFFPAARTRAELPTGDDVQLAIVATPAHLHAQQAIALLDQGIGVLCEKPLAVRSAEAAGILVAAARGDAVLAVGLVRRWVPALLQIGRFCAEEIFGPVRGFAVQEGGPFDWPAVMPSFSDPAQTGGGVLLDLGVHALDVLGWWFGEATAVEYADDAAGGLEAACRIELAFNYKDDVVAGSVVLSHDWPTPNTWTVAFDRATVVWRVGQADRLEILPTGSSHWLVSQLETAGPDGRRSADTFAQAFTRQVLDVVQAVAQSRPPRVSGAEALPSLRLIERCHAVRKAFSTEVPR